MITARANIPAAIFFVPVRRRKNFKVDIVSHHNVFEHGAVFDFVWRDQFFVAAIHAGERVAERHFVQIGWESQRHVFALSAKHIDEHA